MASPLGIFLEIPYSTFFILALAVTLSTVTSLVQKKYVNFEELRRVRTEMNVIRKEMMEARKKGDRKAYARLQRKQTEAMRDSSQAMGGQMKVSMSTMIPFLIIFWILNAWVFKKTTIVAFSPVVIPYGAIDGTGLIYWTWYFLASIAISLAVNRALRVQMY